MTAARRTLLADVEAWTATLPPRITAVPKPGPGVPLAAAVVVARDAHRPRPAVLALESVRVGRTTHLVPAHADHTLCGRLVTAGPWTPGRRGVTCPRCALPPEAD